MILAGTQSDWLKRILQDQGWAMTVTLRTVVIN